MNLEIITLNYFYLKNQIPSLLEYINLNEILSCWLRFFVCG